jgi:3,4-dihydroxy 2-butanone 4-phosphate synthase / GTP cyclohydrolase II
MKATKVAETSLPTEDYGTFRLFGFESADKSETVIALVMGNLAAEDGPLVRIHSQCLTGDVFGSGRCDCGAQLHFALEIISRRGAGILIYQLQEGRGIGLMNKLLAYSLQDSGHDTVEANQHLGFEADQRNYDLCADVLRSLGVARVRLMSNNPQKIEALEHAGIRVTERVPIEIAPSDSTKNYLKTKKAKLGHLLSKV